MEHIEDLPPDHWSYQLPRTDSTSTISSTATAPNLPGPGRIVGNLFEALGDRLEARVNRIAVRRGLGSEAIASEDGDALPPLTRTQTVSTVSTNATAPNLPGAGRTVGNLLEALGSRLSSFVNTVAVKRGLGPEAVAQEIRRLCRHHETTFFERHSAAQGQLSKKEEKALKKYCEKLVKYARSRVLATQLVALEELIEFPIDDPLLGAVLRNCRTESLEPKYVEPDLLVATAKAFGSITNAKIHALWSSLVSSGGLYLEPNNPNRKMDLTLLRNSLSDPQLSFVAARYLSSILRLNKYKVIPFELQSLANRYMNEVAQNPQMIEWSNLNMCFTNKHWILELGRLVVASRNTRSIIKNVMQQAQFLPDFFSRYLRAPQIHFLTTNETIPEIEFTEVSNWSLDESGFICVKFLTALSGSENIRDQLDYIQNLDVMTRRNIDKTILVNTMFVAYCHLPLYSGALSSMLLHWDKFLRAATILAGYLDEQRSIDDQATATFLAIRFASTNRYCRLMMCTGAAAASIPFMFSPDLAEGVNRLTGGFLQSQSMYFGIIVRFSVDDICRRISSLFDFTLPSELQVIKRLCTENIDHKCCIDIMLYCDGGDLMTLEVDGQKEPFRTLGHYPILAGYDDSGEALYVARASPFRFDESHGSVKEGASSANFILSEGDMQALDRFYVPVLRHNPCDTLPSSASTLEGALDPTGPLHWRRYWPRKDPALAGLLDDMRDGQEDRENEKLDNEIKLLNSQVSELDKLVIHMESNEETDEEIGGSQVKIQAKRCNSFYESQKKEHPRI